MKPIKELPPTGFKICQCPTCKYVYSTVSNFDRHRRDGKCLNPADVGLVVNAKGIWAMPGADSYPHREP